MFLSVFGLAFHIAYYYIGLKQSSSINVPIIECAAPIFIIFGSTFFLHEKMKTKMLKGAIVSLIGVILIVLRPIFENGYDSTLIGNLFFIVSMGLFVFYTLLHKAGI